MFLTPECQQKLLAALAEQPVDQGSLWVAYWGADEENKQVPANAARIAKDILAAAKSRAVLVHGRYGTGKSSFMQCIRSQIEGKAVPLWIDMPSLTSNIDSTALAAVMLCIAEKLTSEQKHLDHATDSCCFNQALEDLWRIEVKSLASRCSDPCKSILPPEPNRMAGTAHGTGRRSIAANTLEKSLDQCLKTLNSNLVVFLDDLDRCEKGVAMDVVRLLLRFGTTANIHFVLACDWDVLEHGVKEWMNHHGKALDGEPLVTANSALAKYIHLPVELPPMGRPASKNWGAGNQKLPTALRNLLATRDRIVSMAPDSEKSVDNSAYEKARLYDALISSLLNALLSEECAKEGK